MISVTRTMLRNKMGVRGPDLAGALAKAKNRMPRTVYAQAKLLAKAEPLAEHPKLRMTLDATALRTASERVQAFLKTIDLADQRKGRFLGALGALVFNLLLLLAILLTVLVWRGFL